MQRCVKVYKDGVYIGEEDCVEVSDEQLAEEQEQRVMEKAEDMIDAISNLTDAKVFLKKLCKRLFKNGALP